MVTFGAMFKRRYFLFAVLACAAAMVPADLLAQGCSMCKAVAETQPGGNIYGGAQPIGNGLNRGILFIMAVPYILLFVFFHKKIIGFIKEFRNAQG